MADTADRENISDLGWREWGVAVLCAVTLQIGFFKGMQLDAPRLIEARNYGGEPYLMLELLVAAPWPFIPPEALARAQALDPPTRP